MVCDRRSEIGLARIFTRRQVNGFGTIPFDANAGFRRIPRRNRPQTPALLR
jgi:hypothetical protein